MSRTALDRKVRTLQGIRLRGELIAKVASAFHRPKEQIALVELEETDRVYETFEGRWRELRALRDKSTPCRFFETESRTDLALFIEDLRKQIPHERMLLFLPQSRYCGAVASTTSEILASVLDLLTIDQDDVLASTPDSTIGLVCEHFTDHGRGGKSQTYKCLAWTR
jgi:hypothetical protein